MFIITLSTAQPIFFVKTGVHFWKPSQTMQQKLFRWKFRTQHYQQRFYASRLILINLQDDDFLKPCPGADAMVQSAAMIFASLARGPRMLMGQRSRVRARCMPEHNQIP